MNTILALRGRGNIGKSTTIGILFQLLKNNGFEVIMEDWFGHEKKEILAIFTAHYPSRNSRANRARAKFSECK